jgi:predicted nucleic acid-binding Zn ribbon protein
MKMKPAPRVTTPAPEERHRAARAVAAHARDADDLRQLLDKLGQRLGA